MHNINNDKKKRIQYYVAPLEGITGYVYRNAHRKWFEGADKYFTPFITPKEKRGWNSREKNDILPEHNRNIKVIPQILTNKAEDFIRVSDQLHELGYEEVNLNLGCPSGTVVSKGKGSGFLKNTEELQRFFEEVFHRREGKISIKTRLGIDDFSGIRELMEIYNAFPFEEIIIHARVQKDFYKKPVNLEAFGEALSMCKHPVCYNGDLFSVADTEHFINRYPLVDRLMFGRGVIGNPQLIEQIKKDNIPDKKRLYEFLAEVCLGYEEFMAGDKNVLFKMKELWSYMIEHFEDSKKYGKKIKKSQNLLEYRSIVDALFRERELIQ